jgi:hypothetical protein
MISINNISNYIKDNNQFIIIIVILLAIHYINFKYNVKKINTINNIKKYIQENKQFTIIIVILSVAHIVYFKFNINKSEGFNNLLKTYASFSILLTVYSLYNQSVNTYVGTVNTQINYYNGLVQGINDKIATFFATNKNMHYYYDELFYNISNYKETDRNIALEKIISNQILSGIDSLINYIDSYKKVNINNFQLNLAEEKIKKLLGLFMKSKIFFEHWKQFRKTLALNWTKDYIDLYFDQS